MENKVTPWYKQAASGLAGIQRPQGEWDRSWDVWALQDLGSGVCCSSGLGGLPVGLASWQHFWDCCADTEGIPWVPQGLLVVTAAEASWPASVGPFGISFTIPGV